MQDIIASWIHLDKEGEESLFPQVKGSSSSINFQTKFWKCLIVLFSSSIRFNKNKKHILFTNSNEIPKIGKFDCEGFFNENGIDIIKVENKYKLPKNYYSSWNNQFYVFSILDYLSDNLSQKSSVLILDSDCVFNKKIDYLFESLNSSQKIAFTYINHYPDNHKINGLDRRELGDLFNEMGLQLQIIPYYSGGEVLFATKQFIDLVSENFTEVWNDMLSRHNQKKIKLNEEAHALSYFYYKYDADIGKLNSHIKRCWTNPFSYRNITKEDYSLDIFHLPNEKEKGINKVFDLIANEGLILAELDSASYNKIIKSLLSPKKYYYEGMLKLLNNTITSLFKS